MGNYMDLIGQKFGRLTVIKRIEDNSEAHIKWLCECDCGNFVTTRGTSLRRGVTKSCGCLVSDKLQELNKLKKKCNTYDLSGDYGIGYASNTNEEFYFDLEDYEKIKNYYWYRNHDGYMCSNEDDKQIITHRLIMNVKDVDVQVDHFNRNKKDNRKENLRPVSPQHNNWNKGLQQNNKSGVTGVRWNKKSQKWIAYIMYNHLGSFNSFEDAVKARKRAEEKYFGEYSYNNFNKQQKKVEVGE